MKIKFWGVRDTLPLAPSPHRTLHKVELLFKQFFRQGHKKAADIETFLAQQSITATGGLGANSSCLEVLSGEHRFIIGAGSGIKRLGDQIVSREILAQKKKGVFHILFPSHRLDQMLGLPFFTPLFIPGQEFHVYSAHKDIEDVIRFTFSRPYFPVEYRLLPNKIHYHHLPPTIPVPLGDLQVTAMLYPPFPQHGGFTLRKKGASMAFLGPILEAEDIILGLAHNPHERALLQNMDLFYCDALAPKTNLDQFHLAGLEAKAHLSARLATKRILFGNYPPDITRAHLLDIETSRTMANSKNGGVHGTPWSFVYEDEEIELL